MFSVQCPARISFFVEDKSKFSFKRSQGQIIIATLLILLSDFFSSVHLQFSEVVFESNTNSRMIFRFLSQRVIREFPSQRQDEISNSRQNLQITSSYIHQNIQVELRHRRTSSQRSRIFSDMKFPSTSSHIHLFLVLTFYPTRRGIFSATNSHSDSSVFSSPIF